MKTLPSKEQYVSQKMLFLREFGVVTNSDIANKVGELYPNDVAVENYIRKLILDTLRKGE